MLKPCAVDRWHISNGPQLPCGRCWIRHCVRDIPADQRTHLEKLRVTSELCKFGIYLISVRLRRALRSLTLPRKRNGCSLPSHNISGALTPWPVRQRDVSRPILGFGFSNEKRLSFVELVCRKKEEIYGNNVWPTPTMTSESHHHIPRLPRVRLAIFKVQPVNTTL